MRIDRPEQYYRAAVERMRQAEVLYRDDESYALSMYVAGLAVECMLRAFKLLKEKTFDEKHDIRRLFKASRILDFDRDSLIGMGLGPEEATRYFLELQSSVTFVYELWSNDYRYASEDRLRAHLKSMTTRREVKGDLLKSNALALLKAARSFHDKGVALWMSSRKSDRS